MLGHRALVFSEPVAAALVLWLMVGNFDHAVSPALHCLLGGGSYDVTWWSLEVS
jgi:hypothetical protein